MKIVIAPNAFKQSLSSIEVANALKKGFQTIYDNAEYIVVPMADGGEGTSKILTISCHGEFVEEIVTSASGLKRKASYGICLDKGKSIAFIECAETCGIIHERLETLNPLKMTTYGTGELILSALDKGIKTIVIGVGGTCTNDGAMGILSALGVRFYDKEGQKLEGNGGNLEKIASIDNSQIDPRIKNTNFIIASDVTNKLCGKHGSAFVYGPQKGANQETIVRLDKGLNNFAKKTKELLGLDILEIKGGGSGGGIGAGLYAYLSATIVSGFDVVNLYTGLEEYIKGADLVISGEGKIDSQTKSGKAPQMVAKLAKKYNKRAICFAALSEKNLKIQEFDQIYTLFNPGTVNIKSASENTYQLLIDLASKVAFGIKKRELAYEKS